MTNHPQKYKPGSGYARVLYTDRERHLHSHDLNDAQAILGQRIRGVADSLLSNGNVVRGGAITVDPQTGQTLIEAGAVYVDGMVHEVAGAELSVPVDGVTSVGVCLVTQVISYEEDPELSVRPESLTANSEA